MNEDTICCGNCRHFSEDDNWCSNPIKLPSSIILDSEAIKRINVYTTSGQECPTFNKK